MREAKGNYLFQDLYMAGFTTESVKLRNDAYMVLQSKDCQIFLLTYELTEL